MIGTTTRLCFRLLLLFYVEILRKSYLCKFSNFASLQLAFGFTGMSHFVKGFCRIFACVFFYQFAASRMLTTGNTSFQSIWLPRHCIIWEILCIHIVMGHIYEHNEFLGFTSMLYLLYKGIAYSKQFYRRLEGYYIIVSEKMENILTVWWFLEKGEIE